jgi:hypothetical protein
METTLNRVEWWRDWQVSVPAGSAGRWRVERFTVSEEAASIERMRAMFSGGRGVPAGDYTRLMRGGQLVMSDTPDEIRDHRSPVREAKDRGGRVLIHGLGLGLVLRQMLALPNVTQVDVVEQSEDVIALVGPIYAGDPRVTIHHADAYEMRWPKGARWSVAWHDIWDDICADNLEGMTKLHRRFARRVDWQGSWCRRECASNARRWR